MKLVLINGAPGSGKSHLVSVLRPKITTTLISKDVIKEHLYDTLGTHGEDWSRMLGNNISVFVMALARDILKSGRSVAIEGAFHKELARADAIKLQQQYPNLEIIEVYCQTDPKRTIQRFNDRIVSGERHKGHHALPLHNPEALEKYAPINIGEVVYIDTTSPETVDYDAALRAIND